MNFSDTIVGGRKSYKTAHRRRRRRHDGTEELADLTDEEDESIAKRLARLRREAEEVRLEIQRTEETESKDRVEEQTEGLEDGVEELSKLLDGLQTLSRKAGKTAEDDIVSRLRLDSGLASSRRKAGAHQDSQTTDTETVSPSTLSAIAAFADRLTALETALGISITSTDTPAILPTLSSLGIQITTLSSTLSPPSTTTNISPSSLPHLDALTTRIRTLNSESTTLLQTRKSALATLTSLHEARLSSTEPLYRHGTRVSMRNNATESPSDPETQIYTSVFLDEQAAKITALYHLLPTIQNLQPLLPVVLERLRALSVLHNGAGEAKGMLDELQRRQSAMGEESRKWREAVEGVEQGIAEVAETTKGNVDVVGGMVRAVEERMERLERG